MEEICSVLDRSFMSVSKKASRLNLVRGYEWTEEQINFIKLNYPNNFSIDELEEMSVILGRSKIAIYQMIVKLGLINLKHRPFNDDDLKFISDNYNSMTADEIGKMLGITPDRIVRKANKIGLKKKEWFDYELDIIKKYYSIDIDKVKELIPNRTAKAIRAKANVLGLKNQNKSNLFEGEVFDSIEEINIYKYIKNTLNIHDLKPIGRSRKNGFYNKEFEETYFPDFISNIFSKPLIIEYFGLYNSDYFIGYKEKADRKFEYFNKRNDLYFLGLYPEDVDCLENIKNKLKLIIKEEIKK